MYARQRKMRNAVIFDMDGALCDTSSVVHLIEKGRRLQVALCDHATWLGRGG
jgi:phosphoglycolate phosphatase-like HAD superfamily hydrolase